MYEIQFNHAATRLDLRLWGFWTEETMDRFSSDFRSEVQAVKARYQAFDVLSDTSDFAVQSSMIVPRFGALMASLEIQRYGNIAVVVSTRLNKMQAERTESDPYAKVFFDRSDAIRWLSDSR